MLIISEEMRSISQKMRVGTPMAPLPHMIWQPKAAFYCAMTAYSGQIDARNEFSDKTYNMAIF